MKQFFKINHLFLTAFFVSSSIFSQNVMQNDIVSNLVGLWEFNNSSNLTEATIGNNLVLKGNCVAVDGPTDSSGAVRIGIGSYFTSTHGILPNGGGNLVNDYTIVMDVKIPMTGKWYALYQTDISNLNDGDWFINPSGNIGIGEIGYTPKAILPNEWYRIAVSVSNGNHCTYYIDGKKSLNGNIGTLDGRFSLSSKVLFFADENAEDNIFDIAEIQLYSTDLSENEVSELGGYQHNITNSSIKTFPYLQSPTLNSIYICWSFPGNNALVEYGLTSSLGNSVIPEKIPISDENIFFNWYSAKLENLIPSTIYYYKVKTDSAESEIYKFKTQPDFNDSTSRIRLALYSDNQTNFAKFTEINDSLKSKINSLYGQNIEENLNLVFDSGDIVGNGWSLQQYLQEYLNPHHKISTSVPYMVSIGNHEEDSPYFYDIMKYEDFGGPQGEKYYSFRIGKVLIVALNSNTGYRNDTQINWLNTVLSNAQIDNSIDWIFAFNHHPGQSEIWPDGNTAYVQDKIIPTLSKYSKVDLLTYGHSHNYERGAVSDCNLRLMCIGGAGGALDRWGMYNNQQDYLEIQKAFDHHCYAILDIDVANKSYEITTYSIGNPDNPLDNVVIDKFSRNKFDETPPQEPIIISPSEDDIISNTFLLTSSEYYGTYEIMSSQFQITNNKGNYDSPILDVMRNYENIYGEPKAPNYLPNDLNENIDLTSLEVSDLNYKGDIWVRVRYRDKNLQWSSWSQEHDLVVDKVNEVKKNELVKIDQYQLYNNFPNPFNPTTKIQFDIKETGIVQLNIYNNLGEFIKEIYKGNLSPGRYSYNFDATELSSGIYYYRLITNKFSDIKKMMVLK
ncbi:MAG: metallophosphoesterase [Ignavibacteriae bacterium]|nr:metallophosphoesterase [Ignavibacteriota bacterium]